MSTLFNLLKENTNALTALYVVIEKNEQNENHLHGVIVCKNLMDFNINLKNNLRDLIRNEYESDTVIKSAASFLDAKNWISGYMWKDVDNWELPCSLWFNAHDQQVYAQFLDLTVFNLVDSNFRINERAFKYEDNDLNLFSGCKLNKNKVEKESVIDLILYYLVFKKLYIHKNYVYEKIKEAEISYKKINTVKEELYNKFNENIVVFFLNKFPMHFKNFDFYDLIKKYLKTNEKIIEEIWDLTMNRIEPDFSLLEFKDGMYSIKYNKFVPKKYIKELNKDSATIKYYNKTFKHLGKPSRWINDILEALGLDEELKNKNENNETFKEICCYIANIFHKNKIFFSKKRVLYIHGDSNTRKSTLIAKPLISFFGVENVGFISDSKNFKFQHLWNKKLGIIDEFKYDSNFAQEYLKLFAGEVTVTEKKYSKEHQILEDLPIIILSNNLIEEKDKRISEALFNRIFAVQFKRAIEFKKKKQVNTTTINDQIDEILKEEEPKIIKYCNKVFYESKYQTKTRVPTKQLILSLKRDMKKIK